MKWFWTITTGVAALIIWDIDNLLLLRMGCFLLLIKSTLEEAKSALAVISTKKEAQH